MQSVQYGLWLIFGSVLAQKSRTAVCCSCTEIEEGRAVISTDVFWDWNCTKTEAALAQKSRQLAGSFFWVEISWIFYCKWMSDFYTEEIINSLSLTGFPLVGFSRAIGQKFLSTVCWMACILFTFCPWKSEVTAVLLSLIFMFNHSYIYRVGEYIVEGLECNLSAVTAKISAHVVKHKKNTKITIFFNFFNI